MLLEHNVTAFLIDCNPNWCDLSLVWDTFSTYGFITALANIMGTCSIDHELDLYMLWHLCEPSLALRKFRFGPDFAILWMCDFYLAPVRILSLVWVQELICHCVYMCI